MDWSPWLRWITPCPPHLREQGYLQELLGIYARAGRCREAWLPHLLRCQDFILRAAEAAPRHRKVVILGSGLLNDVPLEGLAKIFREVILVDVMHLLPVHWRVWRKAAALRPARIRLVSHDITGVTAALFQQVRSARVTRSPFALPPSRPTLLQDDPEVDHVISLNLLSQLHLAPTEYLDELVDPQGKHLFSSEELYRYGQSLLLAHLEYLRTFLSARGHDAHSARVSVITDVRRYAYHLDGRIKYEESILEDLPIHLEGERWRWHVFPCPELDPALDFHHEVVGVADWRG